MINLKTKKIVVPFDFSETAENAVKHAAFIAAMTKGELILLNVQKKNELLNMLLPILNIKKPSAISEFISEKLSVEAARIQKEYGVKTSSIFSSGNITTEIVNISKENDADLIIMGTQGGDSKNDLFIGTNTYRTLTKSDLPILTVRTSPSQKGYENIVLPIDLSAHTRQKINVAIQLAKLFGGQLNIIALYNESEKTDKFKLEVYIKQIEKECEKRRVIVTSEILKTEHKVKKTLQFAKKVGAEIIVSMTDQDGDFQISHLSTFIHQLINDSKIPVLCIKPELSEMNEGGTPGVPF
jgi:nucleotide-binding universal stress UspA family protein